MNNAISETINLRPCYLRIFRFDCIPQFGGELSNLTEIEHTGFYEHIIGAEIIIGKPFAVRTNLSSISEHFVNDDSIAHKSQSPSV